MGSTAVAQIRWLKELGTLVEPSKCSHFLICKFYIHLIPTLFPDYFLFSACHLQISHTSLLSAFPKNQRVLTILGQQSHSWQLSLPSISRCPFEQGWPSLQPQSPKILLLPPACPSFLVTAAAAEQSWESSKKGPISQREDGWHQFFRLAWGAPK